MKITSLNPQERKITLALASLYSLRMLGLFLIYPVIAIYAFTLTNATSALIGFAIGAYGLTQALLQIPFGLLSDRIGRKPVIAFGLVIFIFGCIVAALSEHIYGLVMGRLLQGAGAISAVITALLSDLIRPQIRSKAMAMIGLTIGLMFGLSLILGPWLAALFGLSGIFWVMAVLALLALLVLFFVIPESKKSTAQLAPVKLKAVLRDTQLLRLNFSIFCLHVVLTALFVIIPTRLLALTTGHWYEQSGIYLFILLVSFAVMLPLLIFAEKRHCHKVVMQIATAILLVSFLMLAWLPVGLWQLIASLLVFFIAFTLLDWTLYKRCAI